LTAHSNPFWSYFGEFTLITPGVLHWCICSVSYRC